MAPVVLQFNESTEFPARAYLDTNLLLHARDAASRKHRSAGLCFRELIRQEVELNISTLVVDELWWGLFKASYRLLTGGELTSRDYKDYVEIWRSSWPRVRQITDEILGWRRLKLVESPSAPELVRLAVNLIDTNQLAPRDAFHLAIVLRHGIPALVTGDRDFDSLDLPSGSDLTIVRF